MHPFGRRTETAFSARRGVRHDRSLPGALLEVEERAQPPVKRRSAARNHAGLEHLEQLLASGAQAHRALHVRDERGLLGAAEGEERDGDELAHLRGHVSALAQAELVDPVVGLDEVRILARRELPFWIDVAARLLHPRDEGVRALAPVWSR